MKTIKTVTITQINNGLLVTYNESPVYETDDDYAYDAGGYKHEQFYAADATGLSLILAQIFPV